jgi:hypothetical protein
VGAELVQFLPKEFDVAPFACVVGLIGGVSFIRNLTVEGMYEILRPTWQLGNKLNVIENSDKSRFSDWRNP